MPPPPPRCECSHLYAQHASGGPCRVFLRHDHRSDEDAESHVRCDRCPCGKFRVPRGSGRTATHRAPRSKKKGTPWWR